MWGFLSLIWYHDSNWKKMWIFVSLLWHHASNWKKKKKWCLITEAFRLIKVFPFNNCNIKVFPFNHVPWLTLQQTKGTNHASTEMKGSNPVSADWALASHRLKCNLCSSMAFFLSTFCCCCKSCVLSTLWHMQLQAHVTSSTSSDIFPFMIEWRMGGGEQKFIKVKGERSTFHEDGLCVSAQIVSDVIWMSG